MENNTEKVIKVCPDPGCGSVAHNCENKPTYCLNCGCRIIKINEKTYLKKFVKSPFQFDYSKDGERVFPEDLGYKVEYTEEEKQEMQSFYDLIEYLKQ